MAKVKYHRIVDQIKSQIATGVLEPGKSLPSQNELMRHYGVALGTVRQVFNVLQSEGLIESTKGRGTVIIDPAVSGTKRMSKENFIGLALMDVQPGMEPIPHQAFVDLFQCMQNRGKELLVRYQAAEDLESLVQWARGLDTVLLYNGVTETAIRQLLEFGKRVIVIGNLKRGTCPPGASHLWVRAEDVMEMAMDFLYQTGHRRVVLLTPSEHDFLEQNKASFLAQVRQRDFDQEGCRIYPLDRNYREQLPTQGERILNEVLAGKPDVIFWHGGPGGCYVVTQLGRMGYRVPEDVSLFTHHCSHPSDLPYPLLSMVTVELEYLFKTAIEWAMSESDRECIYRQQVSPKLYIGNTVKLGRRSQ